MHAKFRTSLSREGLHSLLRGRRIWAVAGVTVILLLGAALITTIPSSATHSSQFLHSSAMSAATGSTSQSATSTSAAAGMATDGPASSSGASSGASFASQSTSSMQHATATGRQRLVIETANLDLSVKSLTETDSQISTLTNTDGGFIETMNQSADSQGLRLETLTVRIPENQFSTALQRVKTFGTVNTFSQTGQDVTNQHDNLQQQVAELQSEADAYTRLFSKATTMADMLQIQQSLTQVNSEISNLNNQLHQLNRTVEYATISVTLHASAVPIDKGVKQQPLWTASIQSFRLMKRLGIGLSKVIAWLLPWLLLGSLGYGGFHLLRRGIRVRRRGGGNGTTFDGDKDGARKS